MTDRDDIICDAMLKMIMESAAMKARDGFILRHEQINEAVVSFVGQYDLYVAFWTDGDAGRSLVIRATDKMVGDVDSGNVRGNAVFVQDRATAIALHAACRAEDNRAPAPPSISTADRV
jgi:hypothetical protein